MATDAANDINYYLLIDAAYKNDLAGIRHWDLKIGFEGTQVWVKDFDYAQIHSLEVKSIPYKSLFYSKNGKLFLLNSQLPDRNIPSLLWSAADRALPIQLPSFNHNYFGLNEKISLSVIPSDQETEAIAMITTIAILKQYIETAPAIRLQPLKWVLLNNDKVLLLGMPLLPVTGNVFWQRGDCLLPAGYDFDMYLLTGALTRLLNPDADCWVGWHTDSTYFLVEKSSLQVLSLGSFRKSYLLLSGHQ